ncbi:acetyl-CoA carboxylase biotin carboxyl carrier protein [Intestinibacillus massiliensis]|uniref:acetyl-CoA carboxylase biotin carboxyl carrier protein n=1 Tax=Intestinibacillus massiliensis TaxID=1871029 RepID=UPI000B35771A|nr:acetyl-CoA carboxylase biotin carboxyl carrier protein [Intestinibacillus massiliensis]MCB6366932.1 acetyl-CoA carboxylase biotin carboxyl carrier protein [Intestinibacillus massiliensis]
MDNKELKELALELMEAACARKVAEFELETEDFCVRIKTQGEPVVVQASPAAPVAAAAPAAAEAQAAPADDIPQGTRVEAPLVGIFYSSPSPEEPPFVEVGQKVQKGDTLCIIEAMKTMNEISAPCDGTVNRIYAQNGDMVEFKQLICVIE